MINLSKTWSYALKSVIHLANHKDKLFTIKEISNDLSISESLLRRIIANLESTSIVFSKKWRNWWVKLSKNLDEISIYDILNSVWENMNISDCTWWLKCKNSDSCSTSSVLNSLQKWINSLLKIHTLDKIIIKK